jgi:uncharacterized protein
MLELRPTCEHCNKPLPPNSTEAAICTFECTFCTRCVAEVIENVCPNCGGNFCPRPVRPAREWKGTANLVGHPASTTIKHRPVNLAAHRELLARMAKLAPEER